MLNLSNMIPFYNLKELNKKYEKEYLKNIRKIIRSGYYISGSETKKFEKKFANYCNTKYCIAVGNCLDAIKLTLSSYIELGKIKKNDEVLVPANTYIATILAISAIGLKPVLIEPEIETYNINPNKINDAINKKTKAIIVVHLYGQPAKMKSILNITKKNKLIVIEDAAQAHGAIYNKKRVGSFGNAGCFSFFPGKNLGGLGDAGAITTNNAVLAKMLKSLRNYGEVNYENIKKRKYINNYKGVNTRMDEIQASLLNIKLKDLDKNNKKRLQIAKFYIRNINNSKIILPIISSESISVWHLFVIRTKNRIKLINYLKKNNVQTLSHYPLPPHKQKAYKELNHLKLPITEKIHKEVISIPLSINLKESQQKKIVRLLNEF